MPSSLSKRFLNRKVLVGGAALAALSTAAWAFPWDIDMVDAKYLRAYEWKMMTPPEGAVSDRYVANGSRDDAAGQAMTSPYTASPEHVATGERMFGIYCQTCHGAEGKGGAQVMRNEPDVGIRRFPVAAPILSGPSNVSAMRPDGYIYLTIRNGGAVMPGYGQAMSDEEMWATVAYIRTLEGATYTPPAPAEGGE